MKTPTVLLGSLFLALLAACATKLDDGAAREGEGDVGGEGEEGEGDVAGGEGEGEGEPGEGEGDGIGGEGEGDVIGGEGEGDVIGGEGEGDTAAPTCTSNHHWLLGDLGTALMHPGLSCMDCHATHSGAPVFEAAGTVMGALHDEDNCRGVSNVVVRVTGADGVVHEANTNTNGNFSFASGTHIALPYTAEIELNGQVRAMHDEQSDGNCMKCHTTGGAHAAPGRIVVPGVALP